MTDAPIRPTDRPDPYFADIEGASADLERTVSLNGEPDGAPKGGSGASPTEHEVPIAHGVRRPGDRIFSGLARGSAIIVSVVIGAIGLFLIWRAIPALQRNTVNFITSREWRTVNLDAMAFGVRDLFQVTVLVSLVALVLAMPVALGIAIFLAAYAPNWLRRPLAYVIDLLAAVPSVVYGLWGLLILGPAIRPFAEWLNRTFSWFPLFATGNVGLSGGGTIFTAGIVLAVMILPIITAVTREVFVQTPESQIEAALALGATRWEVVKMTILPFGRSGYISGSMLGLGRALGETMALYMILRTTSEAFSFSLFDGGATIASKIALGYAEFNNNIQAGAYIAAGLVLFALTFVVNAAARAVVSNKEGR